MLSAGTLLKGLVSRLLPMPTPDAPESEGYARFGRYREPNVLSMVRKAHLLVDEGSYFVVNNAQTGIIEGVQTGFVATAPTLILANNDDPGNAAAKSLYPDYVDLTVSAAGITATAVTAKWLALVLDKTNRFASGGTKLTTKIVAPNFIANQQAPVADIYFGALTAAAATPAARTLVGQRLYRLPVTATTAPDLIGDRLRLEFGSVENEPSLQIGTTGALMANVYQSTMKLPPVVIPPGYSLLLYTWDQCTTYSTGVTWLPEIGMWQR